MLETLRQQEWKLEHKRRLQPRDREYQGVGEAGAAAGAVLPQLETVTLVLVIMGSEELDATNKNWKQDYATALATTGISLVIMELGAPFGRAIGLRAGYSRVNALTASASQDREQVLVHSLDGSLSLPPSFSAKAAQAVRCGLSVFAPVFKKLDRWTESSFGMVGICLEVSVGSNTITPCQARHLTQIYKNS
jgi:hypothetical protein